MSPITNTTGVTATITCIALEGNRFRAYGVFNGNEENMVFLPEVTARDIKQWAKERKEYYEELIAKETDLQRLIGEV